MNDNHYTAKTQPSNKKKATILDRADLHIREMEESLRLNRLATTSNYGKS